MDYIDISTKQIPVFKLLDAALLDARAHAAAILDNAQEDGKAIPAELVVSFADDYASIIDDLFSAASL